MKFRKDELALTVGFCLFLGIMLLLFLFDPKKAFSELEKRYLAEPPVLTWDSIASGEFSREVETYMADHLPGRDFFVGLNAYANLLTGRQGAADIYVTTDGRLVEAPVLWNEAAVQKNMQAINLFAQSTGAKVSMMVVPSAGWTLQDTIAHPGTAYQDDTWIQSIYSQADAAISTIDIGALYGSYTDPGSLYYRTDHHWTSRGAHLAYEAFCQAAGIPYKTADQFAIQTVTGFQGSIYSRSALWLTPAENLELWQGSPSLTVSNADAPGTHSGPFYMDRLKELDKYTVFLDGNHPLVRLHNPEGSGKLLVVRDSFANCLGAFLAESYEEVILVDLRYYKQPVSQLLQDENIENVLVCYSLSNFLTDTNIPWLR